MSQASTYLLIPEPSEDLITSEPWSIESHADGLMDELFADIDQILDGSSKLPSQTVQYSSHTPLRSEGDSSPVATTNETSPAHSFTTALHSEYVELHSVREPQSVLPETQQPIQTVPQGRNKKLSRVVVGSPAVTKPVKKKRDKTRSALGKLVSVGATVGMAIAGIVFLLNFKLIYRLNSTLIQQSIRQPQLQSQLPTEVEVEADLVQYMLGALAVIDRQEAKNTQKYAKTALSAVAMPNQTAFAYVSSQPTINPPSSNLPPVLAANNTPPAARTSVGERIYIPVYQAPQPMRYAPPPIAGVPKLLPPVPSKESKSAPVKVETKHDAVNMLAVRTELKPVAVRTAPITLRQAPDPWSILSALRIGAAPSKLSFATPPESPTPPPQEQQPYLVGTAAASSHTLEGLQDLGNKSAALFKIDGTTRRIQVGESIGVSGWTLVEVSNGEAIVRRNGEVRSIYTGQNL